MKKKCELVVDRDAVPHIVCGQPALYTLHVGPEGVALCYAHAVDLIFFAEGVAVREGQRPLYTYPDAEGQGLGS